jgi:hypothetical protein
MDRFAIDTDLFETDTDRFSIHTDLFPIGIDGFPIHTCRKTIRITNFGRASANQRNPPTVIVVG